MLKVIDNFSATLVGNYSTTDATITLSVAPDVITSGYLTVYDFDGNQYEKIKFTGVSSNDITGCLRGLSFTTNSDTEITGNKMELKNGMTVKLSVSQNTINDIIDVLKGTTASDGIMKNPAARVISDSRHLVDKEYADLISSAGIVSMLVSDAGGINVNINSGYYILNGTVSLYAGAAAQALTDASTNYIQIVDSALVINTTGFVNNAIPLAIAVTVAGDITSLTDTRPFYTGLDVRAGTNGSLICGAASTSTPATWAAITNASFRATIDGTAYNFDAITFAGCTTMELVAAAIQTKVRTVTSGSETVTWVTDHFVITSGTTGTTSTVSVLAISTGTVGTDISGASSPTYMNGTAGTTAIGTESGLAVSASGIYLPLATDPGLEFNNNALRVKVKSAGGVTRDANGLSVDTTVIASKASVDLLSANYLGVGHPTANKTYYHYILPISAAAATTDALWTVVNITGIKYQHTYYHNGTPTASNTDMVFASVVNSPVGVDLEWNTTKEITIEFMLQVNSVGTNDMKWGLAKNFNEAYNSATGWDACFVVDRTTSKLYAKTSDGGGGADHTEVEITGITMTNANTYRIEFNPGVDVKFYVNAILKATITTTLPNNASEGINIGWGAKYQGSGSITNYVSRFTAPNVMLEK